MSRYIKIDQSSVLITLSDDVLPGRGPDLAWPEDDKDCVLGECLEVLPVLHLRPVSLQHHPHRLHHPDTELVPTL